MKRILIGAASLLFAAALLAQPKEAPASSLENDVGAKKNPRLAAERHSVANAYALAKGRNTAAAEQELASLNRAKAQTAAWHIETAQRLLHLAADLREEAQGDKVSAVIERALQQLARAEALARNDRIRTTIKNLEGFIHERYRGDLNAALVSYRTAAQLSPEDATAAEGLHRVSRPHADAESQHGRFNH